MTDKMKELARQLAQEGLNNDLCVKITVYPLVMRKLGEGEVQEMIRESMENVTRPWVCFGEGCKLDFPNVRPGRCRNA